MWCPEGYVLLSDIREECFDLSISLKNSTEVESTPNWGVQGYARAYWLFLRFVEKCEGNFFAALPNGRVVKLARRVVEPYFPIDENYPVTVERIRAFTRHADEAFALLNNDLYVIQLFHRGIVREQPDWLDAEMLQKLIERQERLAGYHIVEALKPLNGCPVCWKFPDTDITLGQAILKVIGDTDFEISSPNKGGRKLIRIKAAQEFWQTFPLGLDSVSLSEAARKLGYNRRTLREGLREMRGNGYLDGQ